MKSETANAPIENSNEKFNLGIPRDRNPPGGGNRGGPRGRKGGTRFSGGRGGGMGGGGGGGRNNEAVILFKLALEKDFQSSKKERKKGARRSVIAPRCAAPCRGRNEGRSYRVRRPAAHPRLKSSLVLFFFFFFLHIKLQHFR